MRTYNSTISLSKNGRGIWDLDTIKGCHSGLINDEKGCYSDCYAAKTAKRYGIDFSTSINRYFESDSHKDHIIRQIEKIDMPFIRIGCAGDPSEDWEHTINIIKLLRNKSQLALFDISSKKQIVIITRHWKVLSDKQLIELSKYNIVFNTSVSALDENSIIEKSITQYNRLKKYCKSILRVVTCEFNTDNLDGIRLNSIQTDLLKNENIIDTVFRPSKNNKFVVNGIINVEKKRFIKSKQLVSKNNKKAFLGKCANCLEQCGINL